jgi:hypothetical protein
MQKYVPPFRRAPHRLPWTREQYRHDMHNPLAWNRLGRADNQQRSLQRFLDVSRLHGLQAVPYAKSAEAPCTENMLLLRIAPSQSRVVMVQSLRRLQHNDPNNGQDSYAFLELRRASAQPLGEPRLGWLRACPADDVALELRNGFLLVPRVALLQLAQDIEQANQSQPPIRHFRYPRQIYRKLFSRDDAHSGMPSGELLTLVSVRHDLMALPGARMLKI